MTYHNSSTRPKACEILFPWQVGTQEHSPSLALPPAWVLFLRIVEQDACQEQAAQSGGLCVVQPMTLATCAQDHCGVVVPLVICSISECWLQRECSAWHIRRRKHRKEQGPSGARLSARLWRAWGLKKSLETHVLYHKILGTLHLHCRPENTRRDNI